MEDHRAALSGWVRHVLTVGLVLVLGACTSTGGPPAEQQVPRALHEGEILIGSAFVTGYSWYDNTPSGARISHPVLHERAGGTGSYDDPVTVAVGHSISPSGEDLLDYEPGTRFYVPDLQRYLIVEDTCGDGPRPQDGPCHRLDDPDNPAPEGATAWIDVWLDGRDQQRSAVSDCARSITGVHVVVLDARPGYRVAPGDGVMPDGECDAGHGEIPLAAE